MQQALSMLDSLIKFASDESEEKEKEKEKEKEISKKQTLYGIKQLAINKYNLTSEIFNLMDELIDDNTLHEVLTKISIKFVTLQNITKVKGIMIGAVISKLNENKTIEQITQKQIRILFKQYIELSVEQYFEPKLLQLKKTARVHKSQWMKRIWNKYSSIECNSGRVLDSFHKYGLDNPEIKWAVTEKVHGANFAIMYNGVEFGAATRQNLLDEMSEFFKGWIDVVENEKDHVRKAYDLLKKRNEKYNEIIVYGEIFGGLYPHNTIKRKPGTKHVQKGVYYSPALHFYAFDIKTNLIDDSEHKQQYNKKLEFCQTLDIFEQCGFLYCEVIKTGTFEECAEFDVENFESLIPKKLGLPPPCDPITGNIIKNIAEGVVLRKLNGRNQSLKIKSSAFFETIGMKKRTLNINKTKKNKSKNETKTKGIDEYNINSELFDFIDRCITENKYETVMSKIGALSLRNVQKIMGMMIGDIFTDLKTKYAQIEVIDNQTKKILKQYTQLSVHEFFAPKLHRLQTNQ